MAVLLGGCGLNDVGALNPKGPVSLAERDLLVSATLLMLVVVIPVYLMMLVFVIRYRGSNTKAAYTPEWGGSMAVEAVIWLVPAAIVIGLGMLLWSATHKLDPYQPLSSTAKPLEVEVVGQDWKWLFIYPDQNIATVNELVFPAGAPLNLRLTSDTVMNSFLIPGLGGQIYAMAGMQTRLSLMADEPGTFQGRNTQYSGDGFAKQHFVARAVTPEDFDAWVAKVRQSSTTLDAATYAALAKPSIGNAVTYYSSVAPNLFDTIIAKFTGGRPHAGHKPTSAAHSHAR